MHRYASVGSSLFQLPTISIDRFVTLSLSSSWVLRICLAANWIYCTHIGSWFTMFWGLIDSVLLIYLNVTFLFVAILLCEIFCSWFGRLNLVSQNCNAQLNLSLAWVQIEFSILNLAIFLLEFGRQFIWPLSKQTNKMK